MNAATFAALASIHVAAVMTPGANFLVVTQNTLAYSRRTGLLSVLGVITGSSLFISAGIIGFAAIVSQSPVIYSLIRLVGAAYFVYMGYGLLRRKPRLAAQTSEPTKAQEISTTRAYRSGLLTAISNPAAALYFLSLFTSLIPATSTLPEKALAGVMLVSITLSWYALVTLVFSNERVRGLYRRAEVWMNRGFAVLWLALALKLLLA